MIPRSRSLALVLLLALTITAVAAGPRRRAVRMPAPDCAYALSVLFGTNPVSENGLSRGAVNVTSTGTSCGGWGADSPVDWIAIEAGPGVAYVTIVPNATVDVRSARIRIASVQLEITQLGRSEPPEVNLLQNGHFHLDLEKWGWQDRFPNGNGDAVWSSEDASNNIASGSMRLRDTSSSPAFQRLQCVNLPPAGRYDYGFSVRSSSREGVQGVIALVNFERENCTGAYPPYSVKTFKVANTAVWESRAYLGALSPDYKSLGLIVAGFAREAGLQEVWIDDVFLRPH